MFRTLAYLLKKNVFYQNWQTPQRQTKISLPLQSGLITVSAKTVILMVEWKPNDFSFIQI